MKHINSEQSPAYSDTPCLELEDDATIERALEIIESRARKTGPLFSSPSAVKDYFFIKLRELEHEEFHVAYLDTRHRLIECELLFRGTVDGASVYPREVVKEALRHNATAVIFAHNHPSGDSSPSSADEAITVRLKDALSLVDIRVLDHIITGDTSYSFSETGLI